MRSRFPLSHGTVVAYIALFVALGGVGYAVKSAPKNSVTSKAIKAGAVKSSDVANDKLTGKDIDEEKLTGLRDGCPAPATVPIGRICAGSDGGERLWSQALGYCTDLGLRLPSLGEAIVLAKDHDVPGVGDGQFFWSDSVYERWNVNTSMSDGLADGVFEDGQYLGLAIVTKGRTVCVTTPTDVRG